MTDSSWHLRSDYSSYAGHVEPEVGVVLDHWGGPVQQLARRWRRPAEDVKHPLLFLTAADLAPLESSNNGDRQGTASDMEIEYSSGVQGTIWADHLVTQAGDVVKVVAIDETGTLRRTLHMAIEPSSGVVTRSVELSNIGAQAATVNHLMSACWNIWAPYGVVVEHLSGGWAEEFDLRHTRLVRGTLRLSSSQGITGHLHSPAVTVVPLGADGVADVRAGAYGVALAWSGNWQLEVEVPSHGGFVRVRTGATGPGTRLDLLPGQAFRTPDSHAVFSVAGSAGIASAWHRRHHLFSPRSVDPYHRPIVYNSFYVSGFDVRTKSQLDIANIASAIGVEVFVVDDGWFAGRNSEIGGLGDWQVDWTALPGGLAPLIDGVAALGMRFGIWIEPEAVSVDSAVFQEHPEWVYRAGGRPLTLMRNQYVLDLGRPDVISHLRHVLSDLLTANDITYLKWDMNRSVTDGGRPKHYDHHRWSIDHVLGYYSLLEFLRSDFPHVTLETCSGGGGRVDLGSLALSDVFWVSDETGPRDRLRIQHGFLQMMPASVMAGWVTDCQGTRDHAATSFEFRFLVCMAGVLGIGADVEAWDDAMRTRAAELVRCYREIREVVLTGEVQIHGSPSDRGYALEYASADHPPCVLLMVWDTVRERTGGAAVDNLMHPGVRVRPRSVHSASSYRLRSSGEVFAGAWLLAVGLDVSWSFGGDCDLLILDEVD